MIRSFRAFSLAVVFVLVVVVPDRSAYSFAPVAVAAAPQFVNAAGAVIGSLASTAGLVGAVVAFTTIGDDAGNQVAIPLGDKPANEPPAPSAVATVSPTQRSGTTYRCCYNTSCGTGGSALDACQSACSGIGGNNAYFDPAGYVCLPNGAITWNVGTVPQPATCPGGYTLVGSSCQLTNPRQATDDKRCDLLLANGQFSTADDLNCPSSVDGSKLAPMIRQGKVLAYGQNSSGQPLMWEFTPGAQTITVTQHEQIQTATQTQVKSTTATIDTATSTVTGVQVQTSPGSLSSPTAQTVPQTTTTADPATAANTPTVTKDTTKPIDFTFPSDYARTGEAQNAAKPIQDALTNTSEVPDPVVPNWVDPWGDAWNPLKGWSLPGHASSCPVPSFNWRGTQYAFNVHCQLVSDHFGLLSAAMSVVWAIVALFVVLGA